MYINYLYKVSCEPNYPVITAAFAIFQSELTPNQIPHIKQEGLKYIQDCGGGFGIKWEDCKLDYLGNFSANKEIVVGNVVHVETGEY